MKPFRISVDDSVLTDLTDRLRRTRYATPTVVGSWDAGMPPAYLREIVAFWLDAYDWRAEERRLNEYPQFIVGLEGADIHFVHVRSKNPDALPIVLSHGWPYTFVEMLPLLDQLRDFHVVVPSLPGYGFSSVNRVGPATPAVTAELWQQLMSELGYDRYLVYGEDVGGGVSDWLAVLHPESVIGIHAPHSAFPPQSRRENLSEAETEFFEWLGGVWGAGDAYGEMQARSLDTVAASLGDSPAGLAAWILVKFREWSDCEGDLERSFSKTQLITTVMIYWITDSIGTSFRCYYDDRLAADLPLVSVPAGVTVQRHEWKLPRSVAERTYTDLRFFHLLERGGHFTADEAPDLVAADLRAFVETLDLP
jgi:pimeloyl-ACP methyl ester carboxylesterase